METTLITVIQHKKGITFNKLTKFKIYEIILK